MTNASNGGVRRYTDLLTTGYMKAGADGRKIFYPWGMFGTGYIFPSNNDYERLNDLLKVYVIAALLFVMPPAASGNYLAAAVLGVLALAFYWIWMRFELPRLERTEEKMTYSAGLANFARLAPAWLLWTEAVLMLMFVAGGVVMLFVEPAKWVIALGSILFFGAGAVMFAVMLVMRRRSANGHA